LEFNYDRIETIAGAFAECVITIPPKLTTGAKEALENLSGKYKLAIISDTGFSPGVTLRRLLEKENVLNYFSAFSFSDETGFAKPHPQAYMTVLNKLEMLTKAGIYI